MTYETLPMYSSKIRKNEREFYRNQQATENNEIAYQYTRQKYRR